MTDEDDHDHRHEHADTRAHDRRRLLVTLGLSAVVLVAEVVGGLMSHSMALLADAGHMLTDVSAQILSVLALVLAARPADDRRTYGYYRLEILAAALNGALLIVLAGVLMVASYRRLGAPERIDVAIMLPVTVVGLLANLAGAGLLRHAHSLNVRGAYLHVLSDLLSSVAVLIGGVLMAVSDRFMIADALLGLLIGVFMIIGALRLLAEATNVLLEAVPGHIDLDQVRADIRGLTGVCDLHDLHIWTLTSGIHALSAHLVVATGTHTASTDDLLRRVKELLLERHKIAHTTLQIESTEYEHVGHVH